LSYAKAQSRKEEGRDTSSTLKPRGDVFPILPSFSFSALCVLPLRLRAFA
jgi:hypothetical protein